MIANFLHFSTPSANSPVSPSFSALPLQLICPWKCQWLSHCFLSPALARLSPNGKAERRRKTASWALSQKTRNWKSPKCYFLTFFNVSADQHCTRIGIIKWFFINVTFYRWKIAAEKMLPSRSALTYLFLMKAISRDAKHVPKPLCISITPKLNQ